MKKRRVRGPRRQFSGADLTLGVGVVGLGLKGLVGFERQIPSDGETSGTAQAAEFGEADIAEFGCVEAEAAQTEGHVLIVV